MVAIELHFGYHKDNCFTDNRKFSCEYIWDIRGGGQCRRRRVKNMANLHETQYFGRLEKEPENEAKRILMAVSNALRENGYNPVNQM